MPPQEEHLRLRVALGWLESHRKRLAVERSSAAEQLAKLSREIDRLDREIEAAKTRIASARDKRFEGDSAES